MIRRICLFLSVVITTLGVTAQDIHFTQYDFAQLNINPAYTGDFYGTVRVNGVFRTQSSVYNTFNFSGEFNIPIAFRKQDWTSVGLKMYGDKAGELSQKMNLYALNAAYHLSFNEDRTSYLSIGAQYGTGNIKLGDIGEEGTALGIAGSSSSNLIEYQQLFSGGEDADGGSLNDLTAGVLLTVKGDRNTFRIGGAVEGILKPNQAALGFNKKDIGVNFSTNFYRVISPQLGWNSGAWFYTLGKGNALTVHTGVDYKLKPDSEWKLLTGVGTRSLRSAFLMVGAEINDLRVGISYDFDLSDLSIGYGRSKALEIGVSYIYKHYKKPKPVPVIFCPRL